MRDSIHPFRIRQCVRPTRCGQVIFIQPRCCSFLLVPPPIYFIILNFFVLTYPTQREEDLKYVNFLNEIHVLCSFLRLIILHLRIIFYFYWYDLEKIYQKALKDSGLWLIVIFQYSYLVDPSSTWIFNRLPHLSRVSSHGEENGGWC